MRRSTTYLILVDLEWRVLLVERDLISKDWEV